MQSTPKAEASLHVAIIMDGNGRWATRRGLPRPLGHRQGVEAVRRMVDAAPALGITTLSLFAFSSDNWRRPAGEVHALMGLLRDYLARETDRLAGEGVELRVIGRRDRLPAGLPEAIAAAEAATRGGRRLHLRVALDYSSRHAIAEAVAAIAGGGTLSPIEAAAALEAGRATLPDVDLMLRTGGEKRLSDFLLWECAYAELAFSDVAWPEFTGADLAAAIAEFRRRDRRFGAAPAALAPTRHRPFARAV
jgi:undecaprenyl diphosphate synthase